QWRVIAFTDLLNRLFKNPLFPLGTVRSAGLLALDLLPSAKRWLGRQSMGLTGKQPRLARGIGLS
ncbi:MAG: 2-octaprenyl-6-methoxyphenyl hydroxylase, partial [Gammaproteobacteria bacterium]|nr:2-octaprenyl-6-methoxyphenyl hydroxylase [Gammaproteobacteria bacterium]